MNPRMIRIFTLLDVTALPAFILWYIWRLQFAARNMWVVFPVWLLASFLLHRDTPKTLGLRADNLWPATRAAALAIAAMGGALFVTGFALRQPIHIPAELISVHRLWSYFAFCTLQQVALNSLLNNRLMSLISRRWASSLAAGAIFSSMHWPNPVLVPLTLAGGTIFAWLFARQRNVIPLAVIQALLGTIAWWSFPLAWHHHLRVGPAYYTG